MLGTKLLLLSFVAYVSGQGVSYYGSSNVRTQSRLPPRPLYYRPASPNVEPISPVYNPQPNQPAPELSPVYKPIEPPAVSQPSQDRRPPQLTFWPNLNPAMPDPESVTPAPEIPPQLIYPPIPRQPEIPAQPAPRPINIYPRPLQPWTWKPVQTTKASADATVSEIPSIHDNAQHDYPLPPPVPLSYGSRAAGPETEVGLTPIPAPVEEPLDIWGPEANKNISPTSPETSLPNLEINPQTERIPEPTEPEQELTPSPSLKPNPVPDEPLTDPIPNSVQPALYPEPLIPVSNIQPSQDAQPGFYPNPRPLPPAPRPLTTPEPVIPPEPEPITSVPVIPPQPEPIDLPKAVEPVSTPYVYLPPRPNNPMQPPRPNYQPLPHEQVVPSTNTLPTLKPYAPRPNYQHPAKPLPSIPGLKPPSKYPTPGSSKPRPIPVHPSKIPKPASDSEDMAIPVADFPCTKGNGYYKIENECDTYIVCQSQGAFKYTCPDGLNFNPEALYPDYPCVYPSQVQCESGASKQMAQPTDQCPHQYGFFPITGEDCSKYLNCQRGIATVMNCPNGLVFNEQLSSCDWPENVPLCDSDAFKDFTCPTPPEDDLDVITKFKYGSSCRKFVACQRGHPRLLKCDKGLSFDENSQECKDTDLVAACRMPDS